MSELLPSTIIARLLARWPRTARVLVARRMACVGCDMNAFHTVAEAADIYGIAPRELVRDLRRAAGGKAQERGKAGSDD